MPGKVKVKVLEGRNLPVMDRSSDTTDAFVEIKLGNVTYKTDVCRKTLNPRWNSDWYTFEVEDAELQDEPLQIRLMDYDTYTANDAIGKVYINLSPLLHKSSSDNGPISGWLPVYDTIHGIRGEINVIVKVDLFTDFNKFRQSSCGVLFFHSSNIPYGYSIAMYHGFVEELVVNDDPEYQWIDKIRTPRASNEARQLAFMKLSAQVQRKIGIKATEMGANAVIGYMQCYDLEGDVGVVARGIGTAVSLTKINETTTQHIGEEILLEEHKLSGCSDFGESIRKPPGACSEVHNHAAGNSPTKLGTPISGSLLIKDAIGVPMCRRSSDSDLSITPKGSSCPLDKSIGMVRNGAANNGNTKSIMIMNYDMLEMLEYPFFTMTKYPAGIIRHIGATVTARSVKLLERVPNPNEPETRDSWWNEIRTEVRSHARSLGCNVILGYVEQTTIDDDICVLYATGTAAVINLQFGSDMWVADASLNASGEGGGAAAEGVGKDHMTSSLDRQDFDREYSVSREQTPNTVEGDGMVEGGHTGSGTNKCSVCHVPYSLGSVSSRVNAAKCSMCKSGIVPDVLITTIEIPEGMAVSGRGCLIQAHTARIKRDLKSEANGKEISDALPFLEYELYKLLVNKLKIRGMNAIFGLRSTITIGERTIVLIATGTACYLTALPKPMLPKIVEGSQMLQDGNRLQEIQRMVQGIVERNIQAYQLQSVYDSDSEVTASNVTGATGRDDREGKELDLACMQKSACVLELDDNVDWDLLAIAKDTEIAPDGFSVVNVQTMPGQPPEVLDSVHKFQLFTQVWRAKLPFIQQHTTRNLNRHFQELLQLIYYKLRTMRPCVLCDLRFKLDLPEADEIQIVVTGMTLALGDGLSNKLKRKCNTTQPQHPTGTPTVVNAASLKDHGASIRSNDDEMMFSLDEDSMDTSVPPPAPPTTPLPVLVKSLKGRATKSLTPSHHNKLNRSGKLIQFRDGYGVDITPLSYIPGGRIKSYLGNLNFFFIRECTSIRETGGICGFVQSFISEVLSIVRAHVTSLGGNAMIAFYLNDLTLMDNVHKNQGQCLVSVGGDVVNAIFHREDK